MCGKREFSVRVRETSDPLIRGSGGTIEHGKPYNMNPVELDGRGGEQQSLYPFKWAE